ncbi:MAG: hypothetical protein AABX39_02935 [Nanoarchaeota archaeon]
MECPQCKTKLKKSIFDVGNNVEANSLHCSNCQFNVTSDKEIRRVTKLIKSFD